MRDNVVGVTTVDTLKLLTDINISTITIIANVIDKTHRPVIIITKASKVCKKSCANWWLT